MENDVDIGLELYEEIKKKFENGYRNHPVLENILERIKKGKATSEDTFKYAKCLGDILSSAISDTVSPDKLPDGQLYYNIAKKILEPTLKTNHALVNDIASQIQEISDKAYNISLNPRIPAFPQDRLDKIVSAASAEGIKWETANRRLTAPAETMTKSFYDDFIKENAEFRTKAGLKETIVRELHGSKTCDFCTENCGTFPYGKHPEDIFRRHDNCDCTVFHISERGIENVHTKETASAEEVKERIEKAEEKKPKVFSKAESIHMEKKVLTKSSIRGNIKKQNAIVKTASGGTINLKECSEGLNYDSNGEPYVPIDSNGEPYIFPNYFIRNYAKVMSEINNNYWSCFEGKLFCEHISDKTYLFECHGFNEYNIYSVVEIQNDY